MDTKPRISEIAIDFLLFGKITGRISISIAVILNGTLNVLKFFLDYDNIWVQMLLSISIVLTAFLAGMCGANMIREIYFHGLIKGMNKSSAKLLYVAFKNGGQAPINNDNVRNVVYMTDRYSNVVDNTLPNRLQVWYDLSDVEYYLTNSFMSYLKKSKWAQAQLAECAGINA